MFDDFRSNPFFGSHHRQMVDEPCWMTFAALHRLAAVATNGFAYQDGGPAVLAAKKRTYRLR